MAASPQRKSRGYGRALKNLPPIPDKGFVRKAQILKEFPVSSSYWDYQVRIGVFPAPIKVGGSNFWKVEDIKALLGRVEAGEFAPKRGDA